MAVSAIRSGVCFPSYGRSAVFTSADAWDSDYPVSALSLLDRIRRVAVRTGPGTTVIDFLLPAAKTVDFLALIHHNAEAAAAMTVQLSSGADPALNVVHLASTTVWAGAAQVEGYPTLRPYRLAAPVTVRSGRVTLSGNTDPWQIGAIEIGKWWSWLDVGVDRGIGVNSRSSSVALADGVDHVTQQWAPRIATGSRDVVDQSEVDQTLLDFHMARGRREAFVWAWDVDDPATWSRQAFLAKNASLPPGTVTDYDIGRMSYDFVEHLE